ncbi:MAG: V-type ATP synthase subunit B [Nitrospinae bacterium]|nr:V-type ATP synthase subunit B [Nitrospinota bacterium]
MKDLFSRSWRTIDSVNGPLIFVKMAGAALGEMATVVLADGSRRTGQVIGLDESTAIVQVFGPTEKISPATTSVRFRGEGVMANLSPLLLGRVFNGSGEPIDGAEAPHPVEKRDVNGSAINPVRRDVPSDFIQTGISAIDGMNTLVRGQKLPIFSGAGLPANELAGMIISNAKTLKKDGEFSIVFAGMGITAMEAEFFMDVFESSGALGHSVVFLNRADDPVIERLLAPRFALTVAEYLAFDIGMHVLAVLTDMTQYCNALREVSSTREELPGRRGYPGYMYTDLAGIYERAGRIMGKNGSITQLPILTMPDDDITHPIPDLTGYITEGQITLDRDLHRKGVSPPINVQPSLSRLMGLGIGPKKTREDHPRLSDQLYMSYSIGLEQRRVAAVIGEESLSATDKTYLKFADDFEWKFINQQGESRTIEETLDLAWELLAMLPKTELVRIDREMVAKYLPKTEDVK